jgi:hypothetical protein
MKEVKHRGFTITQYTHGDGSWTVFNALGHFLGKRPTHNTLDEAKRYIDERLPPEETSCPSTNQHS